MASIKSIKFYDGNHVNTPNPLKVAFVLEELGLPYEHIIVDFDKIKDEPYISVNPNGKVPAIEDPNSGLTLWEACSGANIEYLMDEYDKDGKLHYTSGPEKYWQSQWAMFQMSGQGPYFGQRAWFTIYHPEKNLNSVLDRYGNEIWRVLGVIDAHLKKIRKPYLVGDKCTYADLMFIPWNHIVPFLMGEADFHKEFEERYPDAAAWVQRLEEREGVKKAFANEVKVKAKSA